MLAEEQGTPLLEPLRRFANSAAADLRLCHRGILCNGELKSGSTKSAPPQVTSLDIGRVRFLKSLQVHSNAAVCMETIRFWQSMGGKHESRCLVCSGISGRIYKINTGKIIRKSLCAGVVCIFGQRQPMVSGTPHVLV